jgi:hypothetical protein
MMVFSIGCVGQKELQETPVTVTEGGQLATHPHLIPSLKSLGNVVPLSIKNDKKAHGAVDLAIRTEGEVVIEVRNDTSESIDFFAATSENIIVLVKGENDFDDIVSSGFAPLQTTKRLAPGEVYRAEVDIHKGINRKLYLRTGWYVVQFYLLNDSFELGGPVSVFYDDGTQPSHTARGLDEATLKEEIICEETKRIIDSKSNGLDVSKPVCVGLMLYSDCGQDVIGSKCGYYNGDYDKEDWGRLLDTIASINLQIQLLQGDSCYRVASDTKRTDYLSRLVRSSGLDRIDREALDVWLGFVLELQCIVDWHKNKTIGANRPHVEMEGSMHDAVRSSAGYALRKIYFKNEFERRHPVLWNALNDMASKDLDWASLLGNGEVRYYLKPRLVESGSKIELDGIILGLGINKDLQNYKCDVCLQEK